jgi:hypothetical protein
MLCTSRNALCFVVEGKNILKRIIKFVEEKYVSSRFMILHIKQLQGFINLT